MKIDEATRFPHPVLAEDTGDYLSGRFGIDLKVTEIPSKSEVTVDYHVSLTEDGLRKLIADDYAGLGIFVSCRDTYYSQLVHFGLADGRFAFEAGTLLGRVEVRPLVWAKKPIDGYSLANCHAEYGGGTASFTTGSVLALGEEQIINVGREKLAQMETIFTLAKSEDLAPNTFALDLDADRIRILIAPETYDHVNTLRGMGAGKTIILNSVYLPAVMQVLDALRDGAAAYEGRRWYKVFGAKCDHFNIDMQNPELWTDAQKLLVSPYGEIRRNKEIAGE